MKLNFLISQYLDGELSVEEDSDLRRQIAASPDAKLAFDESVAVYLAMRDDAKLMKIPQSLVQDVEESILMKILSEPIPQIASVKQKERRWFSSAVFLLAIMTSALLPVMVSNIGNGTLNFSAKNTPAVVSLASFDSKSEKNTQTSSLAGSLNRTLRTKSKNLATKETSFRQNPFSFAQNVSDGAFLGAEIAETDKNFTAFDENEIQISSANDLIIHSIDIQPIAFEAMLTHLPVPNAPSDIASWNVMPGSLIPIQDRFVHISTTFGSDVLSGNGTKTVSGGVSFVAQSLAYEVGSSRVGLEIGYLSFNYVNGNSRYAASNIITKNPKDSDPTGGKHQIEGGVSGGTYTPDPSQGGNSSLVSVQDLQKKSTVWGAVFYERPFSVSEHFSLQARLGAGGTNEGLMSYLRGVCTYDVVRNFSFSLGVNSRVMVIRTPYLATSSDNLNTGLSLIYGVQINF